MGEAGKFSGKDKAYYDNIINKIIKTKKENGQKKLGLIYLFILGPLFLFCSIIIYSNFKVANTVDRLKSSNKAEQSGLTGVGEKIKWRHPNWPNNICNEVAEGGVSVGMTDSQAHEALGYGGFSVNTYDHGSYRDQFWHFETGSKYKTLYFRDGVLATINY
jgi:hypothetical protein